MLYFKELEDRLIGGGTPDAAYMIAGDDAEARELVSGLVRDAKFDVVDVGILAQGRLFEPDGPFYKRPQTKAQIESQLAQETGL